ncbi:CvpA family protein [Desulfurivibrio alkaliphilus]|uniref:Colicin V production protein n=1 Tax=Desulfurivibrio alkaliphilus (strain DSM 19089 / UNIQEM U267 / AHT2) TaxID=589865 RepID=D6Z3W9_DESAT|nr:CvpA family protein [Desulfurivibrio alkaliphilus]ADH86244.1 Colicin V production protein [Desulfurivibrio alkaliphilus AHT 2]
MTVLDAGIIAVVVFFVAWGGWVGFVRQLAPVVALILAFVVAGNFAGGVMKLIPLVEPSRLTFLLAYLLLAGATYLLIRALTFGLRRVVNFTLTSWFDRLSGGLFGLAKAYLLVVLLYFVFSGMSGPVSPVLADSYSKPYLDAGARFLQQVIRDEEIRAVFLPREPAIVPLLPVPGNPP